MIHETETLSPSRNVRVDHISLAAHVSAFVQSLGSKQNDTRGTYQRSLREFLRWAERERVGRLGVSEVRSYKEYLQHTRRFSPTSVSTYLTAVRQLCKFLVRENVLAFNPARYVEGNDRPAGHSRDSLSPLEVEALLDVIDRSDELGKRDYAMVLLMLRCGLSEIELVRADVGDIENSGSVWRVKVQGKGRREKDQFVLLPADVQDAIERYLIARVDAQPSEPLFTSVGHRRRGGRLTTRGIRVRVDVYLSAAGLRSDAHRSVTPYSLRHTAARLMAASGATVEQIQERMRIGTRSTAALYLSSAKKTENVSSTV
jgi:integrase/recombinase XerC